MAKCLYRRAVSKLSIQRLDLRLTQVLTEQVLPDDPVSLDVCQKFFPYCSHCITIIRRTGQPAGSADEKTPPAFGSKLLPIR